jgi:hypothetical protein
MVGPTSQQADSPPPESLTERYEFQRIARWDTGKMKTV